MKKFVIIAIICILAVGIYALKPRSYVQLLVNDFDGGRLPEVNNDAFSQDSTYLFTAYVTSRDYDVLSTAKHPPNTIRVFRLGNGDTFPYATIAYLQFGGFYNPWFAGDTIRFNLKHIATGDSVTWDLVIPDDETNAIGFKQKLNPYEHVVAPPWNKENKNPAAVIKPKDGSEPEKKKK